MSRPGDLPSDRRHVPRSRRVVLVLLVEPTNVVQLLAIVGEDTTVFLVVIQLAAFDSFELGHQSKLLLDLRTKSKFDFKITTSKKVTRL